MKITEKDIYDFKRFYFWGTDRDGKLASFCKNSIEHTAKAMNYTTREAESMLSYLEDVAERQNRANINILAGLDGATDSDFYDYYKKSFDFDVLNYVDNDGNLDLDAILDDGYGKIITSLKKSSNGDLDVKFADKTIAIEKITALKEKSKINHFVKKKHKMIDFFRDKDIDTEKVKMKLDELKKQ